MAKPWPYLPCPFCGYDKPKLQRFAGPRHYGGYQIKCTRCMAFVRSGECIEYTRHDTRQALVAYVREAWNRRIPPEEHQAWCDAKRGIQRVIYAQKKQWPHAGDKN